MRSNGGQRGAIRGIFVSARRAQKHKFCAVKICDYGIQAGQPLRPATILFLTVSHMCLLGHDSNMGTFAAGKVTGHGHRKACWEQGACL